VSNDRPTLFVRALIAFLALPGIVAGVIPFLASRFDPWRQDGFPFGMAMISFGLLILLWCVRDFYVAGTGTLAPWSPPRRLVVVGLYRIVRNPMYVGVVFIITGWCIATGSPILLAYVIIVAVMFNRRVVLNEEPWLQRKFADDWAIYSAAVRRWRPRLTPWFGDSATI